MMVISIWKKKKKSFLSAMRVIIADTDSISSRMKFYFEMEFIVERTKNW